MGTHEPMIAVDGEAPEQRNTLDNFLMEAETVTNARFADFVKATATATSRRPGRISAVGPSARKQVVASATDRCNGLCGRRDCGARPS